MLSVNGISFTSHTSSQDVVAAVREAWRLEEPMVLVVRDPQLKAPSSRHSRSGSSNGSVSSRQSLQDRPSRRSRRAESEGSCPEDNLSVASECSSSGVERRTTSDRLCSYTIDGNPVSWPIQFISDCEQPVKGWSDRAYELHNAPKDLQYSYVVQTPHKSLKQGTVIAMRFNRDAVVHVLHSQAFGRAGGFCSLGSGDDGWEEIDATDMGWTGSSAGGMGVRLLQRHVKAGDVHTLPATTTSQTTLCFFIALVDEDGQVIVPNNTGLNSSVSSHLSGASRSSTVPPPQRRNRVRSSTLPKDSAPPPTTSANAASPPPDSAVVPK